MATAGAAALLLCAKTASQQAPDLAINNVDSAKTAQEPIEISPTAPIPPASQATPGWPSTSGPAAPYKTAPIGLDGNALPMACAHRAARSKAESHALIVAWLFASSVKGNSCHITLCRGGMANDPVSRVTRDLT
ncbi:hypothetical protein EKO04_003182 [Ascochyta lentis]|uniref:Uncharacterized protein n=1 Tax=Ascochyta lentis TaxID=205686 RepID=A0A8H7MKI9_9PLEO|nr:hypothetical protein EKO04_003182 [Ascochyta lentis]